MITYFYNYVNVTKTFLYYTYDHCDGECFKSFLFFCLVQKKRVYSKNTDNSLDQCRRVKTNVDESQTNVDECR